MKLGTVLALGVTLALAGFGASAAAAGDAANGETVYKKCKACHALEAGKNKMGPSLAGIIGRQAGTAEGFAKYSEAMKGSGVVWDDAALTSFLAKPKEFIPENKHTVAGLKEEGDIADVIAYLKDAAM
jgi:cytochrome c